MTPSTKLAILAAAATALAPAAIAGAVEPEDPVKPVKQAEADAETAAPLCPGQTFSQVFAPFDDKAYYTLVQGGSFEGGATGWDLSETAAVVEDGDQHALELPPGAVATSPATCVAHGYRSARLFARALTTRKRVKGLRVEVVYTRPGHEPAKARSRKLKAGAAWAPTKRLSVGHGRFQKAEKAGVASSVQLRFTVSGAATWRIDDVHVDPIMKR